MLTVLSEMCCKLLRVFRNKEYDKMEERKNTAIFIDLTRVTV